MDKDEAATNKKFNRITSPVIKYFDHQGPKVVRVLRNIMVSVFEHLDITTWRDIDQRWMYVDKVPEVP